MADVRALLRNERAQRKINHPQASYSATGTLECTVCHIPLKSDTEVWSKHLKSLQHAMRAERLRLSTSKPSEPAAAREVSNGSKKRKASNDEDNSRKRTKPVVHVHGGFFDETVESSAEETKPQAEAAKLPAENFNTAQTPTRPSTVIPSHPMPPPSAHIPATAPINTVDEDEWAAFERDVATPPPELSIPALNSSATISAAPMTAAEIAAQAREQANTQSKESRDAELEGEKEDAARALEEEFDEMEGLEERVRRLRGMREALRLKNVEKGGGVEGGEASAGGLDGGVESVQGEENESEGDDEDDEDDGWGAWGR